MPLQSNHFKGDQRLEACLVSNAAHVVRGDQGPYVTKIQTALILIDNAGIPANELQSALYGPGTAAAILAFKRARKIINPAYQSQADDIVGKMTMAALDAEMKRIEGSQPPHRRRPVPHPWRTISSRPFRDTRRI